MKAEIEHMRDVSLLQARAAIRQAEYWEQKMLQENIVPSELPEVFSNTPTLSLSYRHGLESDENRLRTNLFFSIELGVPVPVLAIYNDLGFSLYLK